MSVGVFKGGIQTVWAHNERALFYVNPWAQTRERVEFTATDETIVPWSP